MTKPQAGQRRHSRGHRGRNLTFALSLLAAVCTAPVGAQAPAASMAAAPAPVAEELETLVGRIALYPDDLIGIILPSSTNPLQIVQADRYLQKRKADPKAPIDEKWDDAVKSLLNYPDVVKLMSDDLDWTSALGEAVVADDGAVLEAVQAFRRKTQAAGNLKTDDKQTVQVEREVITIVQANPEVIYVPQYNPTTVVTVGYAGWGYYPTPYPVYYYPYPPGAALATGLIWGAAIGAAWNGGHYATHYGGNNNININRDTDINIGSGNRGDRPSQGGGGSSQWKSSKQPGQVSSSVGKTQAQARPGDSRPGGGAQAGGAAARPSTPMAGGGAAQRPSTQPSGIGGGADKAGGGGDRAGGGAYGAGGASSSKRASPAGGSAFSGYDSGRQTSKDSSRGASSRSSMSGGGGIGGGARAGGSSGGGARAGGGGGRRR
ncbi:MAG TPA: DUF3300 domain-containing protein [Rubrivivax sp.]|nr:DUF3300 domain-containing protein [Rubrivivax sp.]